ncbi:MAG: type II toxin-antitoxin system VapC family toxin [Oscillospiraceae bacterium]|nr:type II toxin-antitoxin system VapC family toxin [Oscillospiraceae bacterium]
MRILLDTQLLIWAAVDKLPSKSVRYIDDKANTLIFSSASIWEATIKSGLNRADFAVDPTALYNGLLGAGYEELPVTSRHALLVRNLPMLHKDPFDRILLAQAASEGITFITADEVLAQYPGSIIFVG